MTIEPHSAEHRTLVVDDHRISSRYTLAALRQCAGAVRLATTAREALDVALCWHPDLICMDIRLPDSSGLEVIRRIRSAWPANRRQPRVIVMTGDDAGLTHGELLALNVDRLLVKPVSGRQLREAAGLRQNTGVGEADACGRGPELRGLFREELKQRLPELDQSIMEFDNKRTAGILHQLIASSAMCNEHNLEAGMRALDDSCRRQDSIANLAQAYYEFLESAHGFLYRPGPFKPCE